MRVKTGFTRRRKHKKILKLVKGYRLAGRRRIKKAKEMILKAGQHAYNDRRKKKRVFRSLWIERLSGALTPHNLKYSKFINSLKKKNINIDRKILSSIAIVEPAVFSQIVAKSQS